MSHIVSIQTEVRDAGAIRAACSRLMLPQPEQGSHQLFSSEVKGLGVRLPDWRYPVVCQLETGQLQFDNFGGRWGDRQHLDRFLQRYAVAKCFIEARRQGHSATEHPLEDGSVKVTINVAE